MLREAPYLRGVAVLVALGAFAEALLDYVLSAQAVERFAGGPRLMTFFAAFHTGVSVAAAAVLAVAAGPALRHLGIAGTVALRPAAAGAGALLAWLAPGLLTAVAARAAEAVMRNSLFRTAYELLFIPVPAAHKRPVKAILDVGLDRVGTVLGSLVVMAVLAAGAPAAIVLPALTVAVGGDHGAWSRSGSSAATWRRWRPACAPAPSPSTAARSPTPTAGSRWRRPRSAWTATRCCATSKSIAGPPRRGSPREPGPVRRAGRRTGRRATDSCPPRPTCAPEIRTGFARCSARPSIPT